MSKTSLNILISKYSSGKISREEFLYFHALLSKQNLSNMPLDADAIIHAALEPAPVPRSAPTPPPRQAQTENEQVLYTDIEQPPRPGFSLPISGSRPAFLQNISQFFAQHYKPTVALVGVVGVVSTLVSDYFSSTPDESPRTSIVRNISSDDNSSSAESNVSANESENLSNNNEDQSSVENLAWLMIDKRPWGRKEIKQFTNEWSKLSKNEKRQAKKSSWYKQFSLVLTTNLAQQSALANDGNISAVYVERSLSNLTDSLRSADQNKKTAKRQDSTPERRKASSKENSSASVATNLTKKRPSRAETIRQSNIDDLIDQYVDNYEQGNIRAVARLFKNNGRNSNKRYSNATLNEYQSVFKNTQARSVKIDDLDWSIEGETASGEGRYSSVLKLADNSRKEVSADIQFELRKRGNVVKFERVRLVNLEATAIPATLIAAKQETTDNGFGDAPFVDTNSKNRRLVVGSSEYKAIYSEQAKPKVTKRKPTKTELNDLVSRYVDSYQYGDADEMITLFSGSTWTKDRAGILQMKQDYQDIFDNTASRKISIENLRWKFKKNKAMGTGNLTLSSISRDEDATDGQHQLKNGKIRLVIELRDDEALIAHLYQIFN